MCSQTLRALASDVHALVEGAFRHGTDIQVEGNYVDSHGHVVTWTSLAPQTGFSQFGRPPGTSIVEVSVRVRQQRLESGAHRVELLDEDGQPIEVVCGFLRFLTARDCSANALIAYAYDLRHLWRFFARQGLTWAEFCPPDAIALLEYLRSVPSRRPRQRMALTWLTGITVDVAGGRITN